MIFQRFFYRYVFYSNYIDIVWSLGKNKIFVVYPHNCEICPIFFFLGKSHYRLEFYKLNFFFLLFVIQEDVSHKLSNRMNILILFCNIKISYPKKFFFYAWFYDFIVKKLCSECYCVKTLELWAEFVSFIVWTKRIYWYFYVKNRKELVI